MPRQLKALGFILVLLLGVYGCAKGPGSASATEHEGSGAKVKKLEDDYRAAAAARDQFRQKLAYAEEQQAKAQKELERTRAAADALKGEVKARTAERVALQVQYETFRKNLKDLLGTADAAVGSLNLPAPKPPADRGARK
jgi:septal ring factor EnvC (AmiA/AmiB activator)